MGYIDANGKFVKGEVPSTIKVPRRNPLSAGFENEQIIRDHKRDLVQPYLSNGQPNPEFIEALPEEAERYGFVKKDERNI